MPRKIGQPLSPIAIVSLLPPLAAIVGAIGATGATGATGSGATGATGAGGGSGGGIAVPFTFTTPTGPIGAIAGGSTMARVDVLITTPFDDPAAAIELGLNAGSPSAFFAPADAALTQLGQYGTDALVSVGAPDMLKLTLAPGTSTQGAGILFYEFV